MVPPTNIRLIKTLPATTIILLMLAYTAFPAAALTDSVSKTGIIEAPISQEFLKYVQGSSMAKAGVFSTMPEYTGAIPEPIDFSYLKGRKLTSSFGLVRAGMYPSTYDLRTNGRLTSVKDQGDGGTCWAFATFASIESFLLPAERRDFSENNLKNRAGFDIDPNNGGGNGIMSTAYLTRWAGPVNEADDPYNPYSTYSPARATVQKHVQDVLIIPPRDGSLDNDNLKWALMTYGPIYSAFIVSWDSFNAARSTYYFPGGYFYDGRHAIAIVGWDDNFDRRRFTYTPPGNGAFICKNSWGTGSGEGGYFYISYYDYSIGQNNFVFTAEPAGNYEHIYQYDPLGWTVLMGYDDGGFGYYSDTAWFGNRFTSTGDETLSAAGFYAPAPGSRYELSVNVNDVIVSKQAGVIDIPGYRTIKLETPVSLKAGQRFFVTVKITTPGFSWPVCVERPIWGYSSDATASPGQSYVSRDGRTWTDLTTYWGYEDANVCLKAYTVDGSEEPPEITGFTFGASSYTVSESSRTLTVTVLRTGSLSGEASVTYSTTSGTAVPGSDFTPASGSLTFRNGEQSRSLSVSIINDNTPESNETFVITLTSGAKANITIMDDDISSQSVRFTASSYMVSEGTGGASIDISLSRPAISRVTVRYSTSGGNATAWSDYGRTEGTLTFNPGETIKRFTVPVYDDRTQEPAETVTLTLSAPAGATLGSPATATLYIADNDNVINAMTSVRFSSTAYTVSENAGNAQITVTLTRPSSTTVTVRYNVADGSATAGQDYRRTSGTLTFRPGQTSARFSIPIVRDYLRESTETATMTLSGPTGGATLGNPATATLYINNAR